jgi:hypothetical protein
LSEQLQLRRDTAANVAAATGAQGEPWVDTTNNRLIVNDGATAGGWAAAKLSEVGAGATLANAATAAHGGSIQFGILEGAVTGLSGASVTTSVDIPANCIVFAVGMRVTTTITGPTSFEVGVSGNATQFGSGLSLSAGSTNYGLIGPTAFYSSTPVVLTATGGNFTAGAVRLSICYALCNPSIS